MPAIKMMLIFFTILLAPVIVSAQHISKFSSEKLKADFGIFEKALKEAHPGLYRYTSKPEFNVLFEEAAASINREMSEKEFYLLLNPLVASIGCGHTKWFRQGKTDDRFAFHKDSLIPFKLYFSNNRAFILENLSESDDFKKGDEIISINGRTIAGIIEQLTKHIFRDGKSQSAIYSELNQFFIGNYASFIETAPYFDIRFKSNGRIQAGKVRSTNYSVISKHETPDKNSGELPLKFTILTPDIALLQIKTFAIDKKQFNYYLFIDSVFSVLNSKKIQDLIIDVRDNEGGEENYGGYLYSYLADKSFRYYDKITLTQKERFSFLDHAWIPEIYESERVKLTERDNLVLWEGQEYLNEKSPQANAYKGKTYILVNGRSFSVTSEFASVVHSNKRAIFIGEETGGGYYGNNSGVFTIVTLPNTKLTLGIPLLGFYTNVSGCQYSDRGILPDHTVYNSATDLLTGKDAVMEYTLNLIRSKAKFKMIETFNLPL
jgi:hypothetical protein